MKRLAVLLFFMLVFFLAACGTESTSTSSNNDGDDDSLSGSTLKLFSDDVKECTPYLGTSTLDEWSDWDSSTGILARLFDPDKGLDESMYTHIELLDTHIGMVNDFSDYWDKNGQHTVNDTTATIDTSVASVSIPYLGGLFQGFMNSIPVDRVVSIQSGELSLHMAFLIDGNREVIVEQYQIGSSKAGVYYTIRNGDDLKIWHASVRDRKVQFMWEGDTGNQEFKITECTDSGTNWQVMGGGSIYDENSEMAFMARNTETDDSEKEYYITITLEELTAADPQSIINAAVTAPTGNGVLAYIYEDSQDCLGFFKIAEYPSQVSDLAWGN